MDTTTIYTGVGLAGCALAIAGPFILPRKSRAPSNTRTVQAHPKPAPPSPEARKQHPKASRSSGSVPEVRRPAGAEPQLTALERQLRNAILSADARERLIQHALPKVKGDRTAAIRKVLSDLHNEYNRWS
jgi:hypothetical protein